jgi:basic amino acid/polyamine antiporter, APA family
VREATGLVRSMSGFDMMWFNVVSFGAAWSIIYALEYAPLYGGEPVTSLILTAPGILALLGVYHIFQVSMPRTGGDYVFMSRIVHPSLGLAANFAGYAFFNWFWIGDAAAVFASQGLAQTLSVYGSLTGQAWAINAANAFTPMTTFIIGSVAIIIFTIIVAFSTRLYFRIQNISMIIAMLGVVLIIALLLTTNPTAFAAVFDNYAAKQGVQTAYENFTMAGQQYWGGSVPTSPASGYTFTLIPLWFTVLFWVYGSNYLAGETKQIARNGRVALFGSFLIIFLPTLLVLGIAYSTLGADFLAGAGYYGLGYATNPLPVIPNLTLYAGILTNNPILVWFIGIGVIAGFLLVAPQSIFAQSRQLFAYAFDRLTPAFVTDVNDRWHSPVKAILISAVGGEIFLLFLSGVIGPANSATAFLLYSYAGLAAIALTFVFVSISAILFPYRRRELYDTSCPIRRKILGVPVIVWLGTISLVYCLATIGYYTYNYLFYFGAGTLAANLYFPFLEALAGLFVACIVWFFAVAWYRGRAGIPFQKAFQQIPPE